MNTMNEYLQKNWKTIRTKVRKVTKNHQNTDDLLSDLVVSLLEKPSEYQQDLLNKNKVDHWFTSSAMMQYKSASSPFFYKYKSFNMRTNEFEEWRHPQDYDSDGDVSQSERVIQYIKSLLETYNVYVRTLATEHILHQKSFSAIGREYGVNRAYVSKLVSPAREDIYNKVKNKEWEI